MSVTQKLVTRNFNVDSAANFISSVANNDYFVFTGKHTPYPVSDAILTTPNNSVKSTVHDVYDNMIFSKRISASDVVHVIDKHLWSSNTFYYKYDHTDGDLYDKRFYTVVNDGTEYNVYKCLFNNSNTTVNTNSTSSPSTKTIDPIVTADGYIWKYMYSITKTQYEKFSTTSYIPVFANTTVEAGATPGTIEVVDIVSRGKRYNNYIENGIFKTTDLVIDGVSTFYGAPETAVAEDDYYRGCVIKIVTSSVVGAANQYRKIIDYVGVGAQKKFILESAFAVPPAAGDTYEVYPYIYVWGDGSETTVADGRAIIDSASSNSISQIEMLSVGEDYRYGESYAGKTPDTFPITVDSVFIDLPASISGDPEFEAAVLQPIISPPGGHGSDPLAELGAKRVCISTKFTDNEGGTIPTQNDFRQVGLIKNPKFTNVDLLIKTANTIGSFEVGETVYQFRQFKLHGNVKVTSSSTTIQKTDQGKLSTSVTILNGGTGYNSGADTIVVDNTGTGGTGFAATFANNVSGTITSVTVTNQGSGYTSLPTLTITTVGGADGQLEPQFANPQTPTFKDSFEVGDYFLVNKGSNNYVSTVASIPYDYRINSSVASTFTADNCDISALVLQASGVVSAISVGQLTLTDVSGVFTEDSKIIGLSTGATSIINTTVGAGSPAIQVNDKDAGLFPTAVQLTRLVGDFPSGGTSFTEDERVEQDSLITYAQPSGYLHHIELTGGTNDDVMYISNKFGIYNLNRDVNGVTSGALLEEIINKYPGDFVVDSGQILYLENLDPIVRNGNKSEIIKIILEF